MAYPTNPTLSYSYTAFQVGQGNNNFPGTFLDADLAAVVASIGSINAFLQGVVRSDGKLANGSVGKAQLSPEITIGLASPTVWASATAYAVDETVSYGSKLYICLVAHTAGVFSVDLAAGKWSVIVDFASGFTLPDGSVNTAALANAAVATAKIADAAVTTAKIADAGITRAKAAVELGATPIGASLGYHGVELPGGWLWEDGAAISRTTYAALFAALTKTKTVALNSATTISGDFSDCVGKGLIGAVVEGFAIQSGTVVNAITSTTLTLSAAATATTAATQIRFLPHGAGDGSTTFNKPDSRGRASVGRDDMGGTAAGRITTSLSNAGKKLGGSGGQEYYALQASENAQHTHGVTESAHTHSDSGHIHSIGNSYGLAVGPNGSGGATNFNGPANYGGTVTLASATGSASANIQAAKTNLTIDNQGSGSAHLNMQPSLVCNKIIFAGV